MIIIITYLTKNYIILSGMLNMVYNYFKLYNPYFKIQL